MFRSHSSIFVALANAFISAIILLISTNSVNKTVEVNAGFTIMTLTYQTVEC